MAGPIFKPKTNQTCHQKPNPSRETVPSNKHGLSLEPVGRGKKYFFNFPRSIITSTC